MNVAYCINCIIPTVRLTDDDDDDDSNCSDRRKRICEKAFIMANGKDSSNKFNLHKNILQIDEDDDVWVDESNKPLINGCEDNWTWNKRHRSQEVILPEPSLRKACFHPNWSKGTAAIRGTRILNHGRYYWEIHVSHRVFGTSMMFGVGTKDARLHANKFINMLGEDSNGWGLSHKGLLWHGGTGLHFTKRFTENQATRIGLLFDGINGTLTYYKDGRCLGIAFRGLNEIQESLYPIVTSTAAKTEMTLAEARRDFVNLQDRCRAEILKRVKTKAQVHQLGLPFLMTRYLSCAIHDENSLSPVENYGSYMV